MTKIKNPEDNLPNHIEAIKAAGIHGKKVFGPDWDAMLAKLETNPNKQIPVMQVKVILDSKANV